jgi:hypothetical protein
MCAQILESPNLPESGDHYDILSGQWAPRMSDRQFDFFRDLAKAQAGIILPDYKRNMVYRRFPNAWQHQAQGLRVLPGVSGA